VDRKQPEDAYRLRTECLDRERNETRAVTALLAHADAQVVKRGIALAYGLPDVRWCADVTALRASAGLPDDPVKRVKAIELRDRLDEVAADFAVGRDADALSKVTPVLESARQLGHASTTALALEWKGKLLVDARPTDAYPLFREALWMAVGAGDKELAVDVSASTTMTAAQTGRADEAHQWLEGMKALLDAMGSGASDELKTTALYTEAFVVDTIDRRPELGIPLFEQLVSIYRRDLGMHPKTAQALFNLAALRSDLGQFAEARPLLEESLAIDESIGGSRSRDTAVAACGLGSCLLDLGELDRAEEVLSNALAGFEEQSSTFWIPLALSELSRGRLLRGEPQEALAYAERAVQAKSSNTELATLAYVVAGDASNLLGRFAQARALCEQAVALLESAGDIDPSKTYADDPLRCQADALLGLGRAAEAVPLLERSLTLHRRTHPGDYARAELAMARTLAALHKDPERARSLASAARDELARSRHLARELGLAEAFLKER
jgi:tetratricopeptide (TPR) repeat protein